MKLTEHIARLVIACSFILLSFICFCHTLAIVVTSAEAGDYLRILVGVIPFVFAVILGWLAVKFGEPILEDDEDDIEV